MIRECHKTSRYVHLFAQKNYFIIEVCVCISLEVRLHLSGSGDNIFVNKSSIVTLNLVRTSFYFFLILNLMNNDFNEILGLT